MASTYRQILKTSSIIGGASFLNILIGLFRIKVVAVLLGPAGVGLLGIFNNVVAFASTLAGLGVGNIGTRQVAEAAGGGDARQLQIARRALLLATLLLAVLGGIGFWLLRAQIATLVLRDPAASTDIGWLAIGVALTIAAASQNALLNGMRRIGDLARISVVSAVVSTAVAVAAVWWLGRDAIVIVVIATPLAGFILGHWYVARLPKSAASAPALGELSHQWRTLLRLGVIFMAAGLAPVAGQLMVRVLVQRELGMDALGHFQAAWVISMTYIGFILRAMGTDYYPRLTAVIGDGALVNRMANEQTEVALLLASPVLLAMLAVAPWVIQLLYSSAFVESVDVLRWQILGDFVKIASWPLGYILLASGAGKTYLVSEWGAAAVFVGLTAVLLPVIGISATGVSFLGLYLAHLAIVYWLAVRRTGFRWSAKVGLLFLSGTFTALLVVGVSFISGWASIALGLIASLGFGIYAIVSLSEAAELSGPPAKFAALARRLVRRVF
ncbi:O-antigen translocase [Arenimonas sp. MALMAid1274]|uniref:O-antigen translocase n=1 Tax=Arenimonas sp. MALMAid1274 TaxID=3411630 RepID=UPI003B9EA51F